MYFGFGVNIVFDVLQLHCYIDSMGKTRFPLVFIEYRMEVLLKKEWKVS